MTISGKVRELVRQRANFACEYCGVSETDCGGNLTIDHFQPRSKEGTNELVNLLYACPRCNQYKSDYWPNLATDPVLWNPRHEPITYHLLQMADGTLQALTSTGAFTIKRLRLNRPHLVAYRLRRLRLIEESRLLSQYRDLVELLGQLNTQLSVRMLEQKKLLEEQRELLNLLLERD